MKHIRRNLVVAAFMLLLGAGQAVALQSERAFTTATRYDLHGHVTGIIAPDPDAAGPLRLHATRNTYDARGLLTLSEAGQLTAWYDESVRPEDWGAFSAYQITEFGYDEFGRKKLERVWGMNGAVVALVQYSYAENSLVRCKAVRMNPATFFTPPADACALGPEGEFGPDRITRFGYDSLDQVVIEERAVGVPGMQQVYVRNLYQHRLLVAQTDANLNRTELRYDGYGRLKRRVYPSADLRGLINENDFSEFTYDREGNIVTERKRDGRTVSFEYDANNRPIRKDASDNTWAPDVYYDYDLRGLQLYSRFGGDAGPGETLSYDGFGALWSRTNTLSGVARTIYYAYDADGNRTRVTHPDGTWFAYAFDGLDRVVSVGASDAPNPAASVSPLIALTYARDAKRDSLTRSGAGSARYTRDDAQRLARFAQEFGRPGEAFENWFAYNPASQLVRLTQGNDQYNFREVANRTGVYLSNGLNQYTAVGAQRMAYDANGNLSDDGEIRYTYDLENRLVAASGKVAGADVDAGMKWDTNGRLHELVVNGIATQFIYDGDALVAEYSGGVMTRRYVHGDQVDEPWVQYNGAGTAGADRRFLVADHQGSVVAHVDQAGRVTNKLAYDSYGIPAAANVDRFGFTGQAWIRQLGLYHYKARMYHPRLGRFLQTDPIGYTDDMNLYAYVSGDPINRTDPTGNGLWLKVLKAGKAFVRGESVVEEFRDVIDDVATILSPTTTLGEKIIAGASLASEALPISISDVKKGVRALSAAPDLRDINRKTSTLQPGPHAVDSIPGHYGRLSADEQRRINALNEKYGCHTCGSSSPGTKSGNAVGDHQPPQKLAPPLEIYPQCLHCSQVQGGEVLQEILKRKPKIK